MVQICKLAAIDQKIVRPTLEENKNVKIAGLLKTKRSPTFMVNLVRLEVVIYQDSFDIKNFINALEKV